MGLFVIKNIPNPFCRIFFLLILVATGEIVSGQIVLDTTSTNPTCTKAFGHNYSNVGNGSIGIVASGGTAPYTYSLYGSYFQDGLKYVNTVQNNGYFPGLNAGSYSVVVKDASGVQAYYTVTLTYTAPQPSMQYMVVLNAPTTCTSGDGTIVMQGTGGTPPYAYSIDGGVTFTSSATFTNLRQGFYEGIVMDANGCLAEYTPSNGLSSPMQCGIGGGIAILGVTGCGKDASITAYASHAQVPYHDTDPWNFSYDGVHYHSPNDGLSQDTASGFGPGIDDIYIKDTVTDEISISSFTLVKSCYIYITFINVEASCQQSDGVITVIAAGGQTPYTYTIDGIHYQASNVFTGLASGNYSVTVKDANGEVSSATAAVYNKCPTVTAAGTDETCGQKDGTITATGYKGTLPYLFSIDGVTFQASNVFTGLASGNYTVTIKDARGFAATANSSIGNNCLKLGLSPVNTSCGRSNGSITATGSNGTAPYSYSIDGINFQSGNVFTGLAAGPYTITLHDAMGLTSTAGITLADSPSPQISLTGNPASCNNTGGSVSVIRSGGTAPFQYSIDNGAVQSDSIFTGLDSAQYMVMVTDSNGCTANGTIRLPALPTPGVFLGDDTTLCEGAVLTLYAADSVGYQYRWQDGSSQRSYAVTNPGLYTVSIINSSHCSASGSIAIRYRPLPVFTLGNDTSLCNGQTLLLKPALLPYETYVWATGSTAATLTINAPGSYWLRVSDSGCVRSDTIDVGYKAVPIISLGDDSILCDGQTLLLDATYGNSTYVWQDGSSQPTFLVSRAGTYSVRVTQNGCDTSAGVTIGYISKPVVDLVADTTICITQQLVLDATYPNSVYEWQDGSTQPQYTITKEGVYTVSVTNKCGTSTDSTIAMYEDCACKFYVPSAFTPNGDGRNDVFLPKYLCLFTSYQLTIYNRWGQLVFASANPSDGWDGRMGGSPQPSGTYVWEMAFKDVLTGKLLRKNGTVVLIR